jgi:hypothetical protein
MRLADQIEEARNALELLERQAAGATCADLGHDWQCLGGCNCGCHEDACCSVPVHECARCKDCDYGQNSEADKVRAACELRGEGVSGAKEE